MLTWGWLRRLCSSMKVPVLLFFYFFLTLLLPIIGGRIIKSAFPPPVSLFHALVITDASILGPQLLGRQVWLSAASPRWFRVYVWIIYFVRVTAGLQLLVCNCRLLAHHKHLSGLTWSTPAGILLFLLFPERERVRVFLYVASNRCVWWVTPAPMKIKRKFNLFSIFNSAYRVWP